jgi:hypothetical protein
MNIKHFILLASLAKALSVSSNSFHSGTNSQASVLHYVLRNGPMEEEGELYLIEVVVRPKLTKTSGPQSYGLQGLFS